MRSSGRDGGVVGFKGQGPECWKGVCWQEEGYAASELDKGTGLHRGVSGNKWGTARRTVY